MASFFSWNSPLDITWFHIHLGWYGLSWCDVHEVNYLAHVEDSYTYYGFLWHVLHPHVESFPLLHICIPYYLVEEPTMECPSLVGWFHTCLGFIWILLIIPCEALTLLAYMLMDGIIYWLMRGHPFIYGFTWSLKAFHMCSSYIWCLISWIHLY